MAKAIFPVAILISLVFLAAAPAAAQQVAVASVSCTPQAVNAPGTSTCTVTLSAPAMVGGLWVSLLSTEYPSTSVATQVFIQQGLTSAQFTVTVNPIPNDEQNLVIAYANDTAASFQMALIAQVQVSSLSCLPGTLLVGQTAVCTLTLNKPTPAAATVTLSSSTSYLTVPANVIVPSGALLATFTVQASTASTFQTATVTANYNAIVTAPVNLGAASTTGAPNIGSVVDAADGWSTTNCTSGAWRTITGLGFTTQPAQAGTLMTTLGGVQVLVNGTAAPLTYASETAVTFQCPALAAGSPIQVTVTIASGSATVPIQSVVAAAPAIFVADAARNDQGLVLIGNTNVLAMPVTSGVSSGSAVPGEYVSIFATGLGGVQGTAPALATATVTAWIGGIPVTPIFAGMAQAGNGVFQVIAQVPASVIPGTAVPLYLEVATGGSTYPSNEVMISVN